MLLFSQLFFICTTYLVVLGAPTKESEEKNPRVEDFIDKLLSSDKFDKIADKIAERTADKIVILQNEKLEEERHHLLDVRATEAEKKTKADKEEKESKETKKHKNQDNKKSFGGLKKSAESSGSKEKEKKKDEKDEPKIDAVAAIQKFAAFPSENLSLNFKHFTTSSFPHRTVTKYMTTTSDRDDVEDIIAQPKKKKHETKSKERHDKLIQRVHESLEDEQTDRAIENDVASSMSLDNKASKSQEISNELTESIEREKKDSEQNENNEASKSEPESAETTTKANKKKPTIKTTETPEKSESADETPPVEDIKKYDASENSGEGSDDNKVMIADSEKTEKPEKSQTDYRHMIREENGKKYAFEQSPDYDEYHDKLAKLLKSVQSKRKQD